MTELTPKLFAIEVPNHIASESIFIDENNLLDSWNPHYKGGCQLPEGQWKLIGTIDKDGMDFDCKTFVHWFATEIGNIYYKDYRINVNGYPFSNPADAFRSLLASKNLHWENPICKSFPKGAEIATKYEWEKCENALIKGKLVIIEKL